jgi:hypothetical protein
VGEEVEPMILARAQSACGHATVYKLGAGGRDPDALHPGKLCDCSGYVAWVFRSPRKVPEIGWIETSRIVRDATHDQRLFHRVSSPVPGDVVVYGDWTDAETGRHRQGHIGILSAVPNDVAGAASWWDGLRVIHCSVSNSKRGDAIAETDARVFRKRGIFARWNGH